MFGAKRLKKKSQSVDIGGPGCNPVAPEAQTPQQSKSLLATKTAASEEEQNNTTNTQRRNPRRSELKRYYTIAPTRFLQNHFRHPRRYFISCRPILGLVLN